MTIGPAHTLAAEATILPPFVDHHVHTHLVDVGALSGIAVAVDLGGDPAALAQRRAQTPHVAYAGAMLTAPGGYPTDRPWAPAAIWRAVAGPAEAEAAVDEQARSGASVIKVVCHRDAGPVFDEPTLRALVAAAHARSLPVVAHVEGEGMPQLALDAGVDALAHAPFTEVLPDAHIARAVAAGQAWISTLTIHADPTAATSNLARFAAAGGRVLYGTDLGNGTRAGGLQRDELEALYAAGVRGDALVAALTDPWPLAAAPPDLTTAVPGPRPAAPEELPAWLARARTVAADPAPTEGDTHDR